MGEKQWHSCPIDKKHADILRALRHFNVRERTAFFRAADEKLIRCICECIFNVLCGNVSLQPEHKADLKKYACILRKLVQKKKGKRNLARKRRLIVQKGGFLPTLLIPILSTVLSQLV